MKKAVLFLLAAVLIVALPGCTQETTENEANYVYNENLLNDDSVDESKGLVNDDFTEKVIAEGADYTVGFAGFEPDVYSDVQSGEMIAELPGGYYNMDENWIAAATVVYGTVTKLRYFDETGFASTFYDFRIEMVYKGNLSVGDMITVDTPGGYLRLEKKLNAFENGRFDDWSEDVIRDTIFYMTFDDTPAPEIGDRYFLFLNAETEKNYPEYVEGVLYYESGVFRGRYYYNESGRFERHCPFPGTYTSPERAEELYKEYGEDYHLWLENEDLTYTFEELDSVLKNYSI